MRFTQLSTKEIEAYLIKTKPDMKRYPSAKIIELRTEAINELTRRATGARAPQLSRPGNPANSKSKVRRLAY